MKKFDELASETNSLFFRSDDAERQAENLRQEERGWKARGWKVEKVEICGIVFFAVCETEMKKLKGGMM